MSEPRAIEQTLTIPYSWGYGAGLEMFFSGTRDRKIIGLRCPSCEGVIVPPSEVCGRCFAQLDWVFAFICRDKGPVVSCAQARTPREVVVLGVVTLHLHNLEAFGVGSQGRLLVSPGSKHACVEGDFHYSRLSH